ncbi:MAG TPA: hypothetical protein VK053_18920 [Jiangellaceae bacterium]|nr:hypothetical protein [Jiangellaceae bacterium]
MTELARARVPHRSPRRRRIASVARFLRDERGDVPGWVLITIMTAGLVAVLWQFAEPYLTDMLQSALDLVTG